jgi:hypothetical protein
MTQARPSPWLQVAVPLLAAMAVTPALVRFWPEISQMLPALLPIWARMGVEAAALLAAGIIVAALAAVLMAGRRPQGNGDA